MLYSDETPRYVVAVVMTPLEVTFMVDFMAPWYTQRVFVAKLDQIPHDGYDAQQYFLQLIEAEVGYAHRSDEYAAVVRLADDMTQAAFLARA